MAMGIKEAALAAPFALPAGLSQFPLTVTDQMPGFSKQCCNWLGIPTHSAFHPSQGFGEDIVLYHRKVTE